MHRSAQIALVLAAALVALAYRAAFIAARRLALAGWPPDERPMVERRRR